RLPLVVRGADAERGKPALGRAETARRARAAMRFGAIGVVGAAAMALAIALVLGVAVGVISAVVTLAVVAAPLGFVAALLAKRARTHAREIPAMLDEAWLSVASGIAQRSEGSVTPEQLATALGVDAAHAEALLALLDANDVVRAVVGDDGQLRYRPRLRVDE